MMPAPAFAARPARPTAITRLRPATRLAVLGLGLLTSIALPASFLVLWLSLLALLLLRSGVTVADLVGAATPWWPLAVVIVVIHTLTTTEVAPLGHPSWIGAVAGLVALARVAATILCLWLFMRSGDLTDLTAGLSWWLQPLRPLIGDPVRVGVVLAVALGAAPRALADARRIDAVVRLRRSVATTGFTDRNETPDGGGLQQQWARWWRRGRDRAQLVVPLVEGIFRRADGMSLALAGRLPRPDLMQAGPTAAEAVVLGIWSVAGGLLWFLLNKPG